MSHDTRSIPHGTRNGYSYYKCRCEPCKAAQSEYGHKRRGAPKPKKPWSHGTLSGYTYRKCRCEDCKKAAAEYGRRVPSSPIPHGTANGYKYYKCRCEKCKAAQSKLRRGRYEADPETFVERSRRWREREGSREKMAEYARGRRADPSHRQLKCDVQQRREARKRGAFVENVPRSEIFERDNWQCQILGCLYPGIPVKLDGRPTDPLYANVDHIVPLAKGGLHERSNLATAHFRCNCVKKDRIEGIA